MSNRFTQRGVLGAGETPLLGHFVGVLPAAGAFTSQVSFIVPTSMSEITYWITYTRGAAGGFAVFRQMFSYPSGAEGQDIVLNSALAVVQPRARQQFYLQDLEGPQPLDASPLTFVMAMRVPRGTTRARLLAAEAGVVGTPGDVVINYTMGSGR